ncbi:MAG TPA: SRPBCC family protein [Candidatus Nitrosotalea sp.]|nr:SRPBCC family protein [Candidatus Nitrosotalea sp.]
MRERRFAASVAISASPAEVFAFISDHRHVPEVLEGVERWQPLGVATGLGARFEVIMTVFGFPLHQVLVIDLWDPPSEIGWVSEGGAIGQHGGWILRPTAQGAEVSLEIGFRAPDALSNSAIGRLIEGAVRGRLERALARLREALEASATSSEPGP